MICRLSAAEAERPYGSRASGIRRASLFYVPIRLAWACDNKACVLLPIDSLIPEIQNHLRSAANLVLEAPPGAGKTTRVPPALLELLAQAEWSKDGREVLVLEPRRLAARLAARF